MPESAKVQPSNGPEIQDVRVSGSGGGFERLLHHQLRGSDGTFARQRGEAFCLERRRIQTVHCYTNSQRLMDMAHPQPRRPRAAAFNVISTTSTALQALPEVIPELAGRLVGVAYRVPVPDGSLVDLSARLATGVDAEAVRDSFREAAGGEFAGILAVTDEELVSSDFVGSPFSATVDLPLVQVVGEGLVRVVAWYDNEWGYANRPEHSSRETSDATSTSEGGASGQDQDPRPTARVERAPVVI